MAQLQIISAGFIKHFLRQEVQNAAPQKIKEVGLGNFGISAEKIRLSFRCQFHQCVPRKKLTWFYHITSNFCWGFYAMAMFYSAMLLGNQASSHIAGRTAQIVQTKFDEMPCVNALLLPTHFCDTHRWQKSVGLEICVSYQLCKTREPYDTKFT